jgi:hypothetical protein
MGGAVPPLPQYVFLAWRSFRGSIGTGTERVCAAIIPRINCASGIYFLWWDIQELQYMPSVSMSKPQCFPLVHRNIYLRAYPFQCYKGWDVWHEITHGIPRPLQWQICVSASQRDATRWDWQVTLLDFSVRCEPLTHEHMYTRSHRNVGWIEFWYIGWAESPYAPVGGTSQRM